MGSCVFLLLYILGNLSKGRDVAGHVPVREGGQFDQREPLILWVLAFLALDLGLAGPLCVPGLQKHPPGVSTPVGIPKHLKPPCSC